MSILSITRNKNRLHKHFLSLLALCLAFTLVMANAFGGNALAASVGDVVTQVSNANLGSPEFNFGQEEATGYGFAIHAGMGDFGSGGCMLSVLGPAQPDEIQIMIDYVDSISEISYMQTTQLKGCEVREYASEEGVGIGVVLPDYFITVEMLQTGQSQSADLASAKSIAQQTIDALEKAGLLSQAAPDIEAGTADTEEQPDEYPATAEPLEEPVRVADTTNIMAVNNGPTVPTTFSVNSPHLVTEIHDYHWNNAQGATPGTIGLQDQNGKMYGPWQAVGTPGQGGVPNANWHVYPNIVIPAGTYTIIDSDPATWSQNGESGGKGMSYVMATPHFKITGTAGTPGSYPIGHSHSPAGVGSVGNIPGPSNTTEAVTGVVVPGLIATVLGALGGLGGGGLNPPAGGTPMYPTGGGSLPETGGSPGTGSEAPGLAQATSQLGHRRKKEILVDTTDMYHGSAIEQSPTDQGIYIETEREAELFVQPEPLVSDPDPETFIDNMIFDMKKQDIDVRPIEVPQAGGEPGIIIDTVDMLGEPVIRIDTDDMFESLAADTSSEPETFIDTIDMNQQAIDIREAGGEPGILIDTDDMFESPGTGASGDEEVFIETEDEAALFVKDNAHQDMEAGQMKPQAFSTREGEAGGEHFAVSGNSEGVPISDQTERLYTDTEGPEVLLDASSLEAHPDLEIESDEIELQAIDTREGEAGAPHFAVAENREGAPVADQSEQLSAGAGEAEAPGAEPATAAEANGIYDQNGFDADGYDREGFNQAGFDADGFDKEGYNQEGFDKEGYDKAGYDKEGFDREGLNSSDYDRDGFNSQGYDRDGFDKNGFDKDGFNRDGFNARGFDRDGFDANGFDAEGFDKAGFDAEGFDRAGFDKNGFDKAGFNAQGFDKEGFDKAGYDTEGFNRQGIDKAGFDKEGFNKEGFDKAGFNREGFNKAGFDQEGFDKNGFNAEGYDREGFDQAGFDKTGYDREGFNKEGFDKTGFDKEGFDNDGFNAQGFDREGFDKAGFDQEGFDRQGFDREGLDREGFNRAGFDTEGYDREGYNKEGFDREGYGRNGFDPEGFDREGYDINGYDRQGFNRQGFDAKGFDKQGFDKEGFNQDGWDREGYDRNGFDKNGWDREGFDKNGYDAEGYDRDGYNREGQSKEGYDADGYDKNGFNKHGYDRDGYDRDGFDFEGYNRSGRDPWGYDNQGYGKDGYHWSGYNADGYDRAGRHWTENPYEEGSLWNVDTRNPFDGGIVDLGGRREAWEPTKPPLGEPYHRTVEKYGAKPWTDEIPKPDTEKQSIPVTEDTDAIGTEDPMNTLKNHGIDQDAPEVPDVQDGSGMSIPEENVPDTGNIPPDTYPGEGEIPQDTIPDMQPVSGPQHGDTITLPGKDGRDYVLDYNAETGEWENILTGGKIRNEDLDSYINDFNKWQDQVADDKKWSADELEKLASREDATSKAIDKNLEDWRKLEQMQKAADKYNIGETGGPGDVDKVIQDLKDDMLAGKELDQEKMDKVRRVIDSRILGKTTADTGQRWEEDWFKKLGWALEANAATAKEVITGEKSDGTTSWLGMGARIMITTATGGGAGVALDGAMNVAEAMYRIKDEIDKGESDFRAISKAIGTYVLGEEIGWLAGEAGGKLMGEMMERFPAFTNKTADFLETAILKGNAKNQMWSEALGMISKESAEESLDQINKRLVDIGSDKAAKEIVDSARLDYGLKSVADSFDDVTKGAGKTVGDTTGDMAGRVSKSASEGWTDVGESGGRAATSSTDDIVRGEGKTVTSSTDDIARGGGKAATSSSDDIAKGGGGKAVSQADADGVPGTGKAAPQADADGVQVPRKAGYDISDASGKSADSRDVPGEPPGRPPGGGDVPGEPPGRPPGGGDVQGEPERVPLNRGARAPEEVLGDPSALNQAERTMRQNVKDFDQLPAAKQQELIRDQAIYDEYRIQAEEKAWNVADKVQQGEPLTVEDIMEMKSDPASMRTLKNLEEMDGLGSQLTPQEAQAIQREFNRAMDEGIHQPSYRAVEEHLHGRYPGADPEGIRVRTVRTPGTEPTDFNINTDNDVIAERLVHGPQGPEWVEIPKAEWEDTYYKALADNSGFSVEEATRRFPETDWANMDEAKQVRQWAKHHEEAAMDQFDPSAGRDFSTQRTWRIPDGDMPGRPMIELTEDELARGVDYVTIDGKPMRPSTGYELTQRGQGTMLDPEQLSLMEQKKFDDYWNSGDTPAQVMRNQTEAIEQLRKTACVAESVEQGYRDMGYRVEPMPDNMKQAIAVIKDNSLSPAARAARLQELGYSSPGDFLNKVSSRIGAIKIALK